MDLVQVGEALSTLASFLAGQPEAEQAVRARWRAGVKTADELSAEVRAAADLLGTGLPSLIEAQPAALAGLLAGPGGELLLSWCSASAWRHDAMMAAFLELAVAGPHAARARAVAGDRV